MNENEKNQKSEYEVRRQQKLAEQQSVARKRFFKRFIKIIATILIVGGSIGGFIWYGATRPPIPEDDIISRSGIHWHPELSIVIKGQKQEISANVGLGAVHQTFHTHDTSGVLHLEQQDLVTKKDILLGRFFKIWGKEFNRSCIFDSCNGSGGKVAMLVNGKENTEFENYLTKDQDKIEIRYE